MTTSLIELSTLARSDDCGTPGPWRRDSPIASFTALTKALEAVRASAGLRNPGTLALLALVAASGPTNVGCQPRSVFRNPIWDAYVSSVVQSSFGIIVSASQQVLLQSFPSADLLQTLLGGNRQPFFQF